MKVQVRVRVHISSIENFIKDVTLPFVPYEGTELELRVGTACAVTLKITCLAFNVDREIFTAYCGADYALAEHFTSDPSWQKI